MVATKMKAETDTGKACNQLQNGVLLSRNEEGMIIRDEESCSSSVQEMEDGFSPENAKLASSDPENAKSASSDAEEEDEHEGQLPVFFPTPAPLKLTISRSFTEIPSSRCMKLTKTIHVCDVCSKAFTKPSHLKRHRLIHSDQKDFACEVCAKAFTYAESLGKHRLTHLEEKNIYCDLCGKAFSNPDNMKKHRLIHAGRKNHVCGVCGKAFGRAGHLKTHMLIHTDEKPLVCNVCQQAFRHYGPFKQHKLLHKEVC